MSSQRLAAQAFEVSLAVPQVVANRLSRMAAAGLAPNARDREEFLLMGAEKVAAFYQSWANMWWQAVRMQFEVAQSFGASALGAWAGNRALSPWTTKTSAASTTRLLSAGLAPVHRKVVGNARRLSRRRK
jgi:hypothetical protein